MLGRPRCSPTMRTSMAFYEGAILDVQSIGRRLGTRYRVELAMIDGEVWDALVYWEGIEGINADGHATFETFFRCWFHHATNCQCCEAVAEERKRCFLDTDHKD
jgi:hypothetical protein